MHLSVQLYTAHDVEPLDLVLDVLKRRGITHVEGWNANYDASFDLRGALLARQMTMPSTHVSLDRLKDGGFRRQVAQDFGIRLFIVPGTSPDRLSHREACLALAAELLELSRDLERECDLDWLVSAGIEPALELRKSRQQITALHM